MSTIFSGMLKRVLVHSFVAARPGVHSPILSRALFSKLRPTYFFMLWRVFAVSVLNFRMKLAQNAFIPRGFIFGNWILCQVWVNPSNLSVTVLIINWCRGSAWKLYYLKFSETNVIIFVRHAHPSLRKPSSDAIPRSPARNLIRT